MSPQEANVLLQSRGIGALGARPSLPSPPDIPLLKTLKCWPSRHRTFQIELWAATGDKLVAARWDQSSSGGESKVNALIR